MGIAPDETEHDPEESDTDESDTGQVERVGGAPRLHQAPAGHRQEGQADGHVEPEDVLPGPATRHRTADEWTDGYRTTTDGPPEAERGIATFRSHGRAEQGERQRHDHRSAGSLECPGRDQNADAGRQCGGRRRRGEQRDAGHEDPPTTEPLAEGGGRQQEDGERQGVGVDGPLEARQSGVEVHADDGQRRRDDQIVEGRHEQGQPRDDDGPYSPRPRPGIGRRQGSPRQGRRTGGRRSTRRRSGRGAPGRGGAVGRAGRAVDRREPATATGLHRRPLCEL